jgi:superfamily I DNA and/or RNA helicase
MGLTKTLLDITFEKNINIHLLDTQYRMNEQIMAFSNEQFYNGKLKAGTNVKMHYYQTQENVPPVLFIDTAGCGFDEVQNEKTRSIFNPEEGHLLFSHLDKLLTELTYNHHDISIGIIAPYKQQSIYLKEFDADNKNFAQNFDVATHTIDSFQGQEKDIIYISLTRSNPDAEIGFLKDYRRMNVAMTRARKQLIILGDSTTLASDKFYGALIDFCQEKNYYKSAWEFLY